MTLLAGICAAEVPVQLTLVGDWEVQVSTAGGSPPRMVTRTVTISPPVTVVVTNERYDRLPVFNPNAAGWLKGVQLRGVRAQETTAPGLLAGTNLEVRASAEVAAEVYRIGEDFGLDPYWGTFGRLPNGRIKENQPVFVSYRYTPQRLDTVLMDAQGTIFLRAGEPRSAAPEVPKLRTGERRLANIWLAGPQPKLTPNDLFPILETAYPAPPKVTPAPAEKFLPKTLGKLRKGEAVRILAWGDSVTDGTYLPDFRRERWQEQFVARLRERFPRAKIELVTEAWGGRSTGSYLAEPPGSPHNYREKVVDAKADLIVSEFVNDAGLNPQQVEERYGKLLADFQSVGAEWIILTPHYVRPDWMGLDRQRDIDDDPRPYVRGLREFARRHGVALADASLRYGRLWRQGIPYNTLMLNAINHPNAAGMKLFADALMELFP